MQDTNHTFYVTEYADGGDLWGQVNNFFMSEKEAGFCTKQILDGVAYLHTLYTKDTSPTEILILIYVFMMFNFSLMFDFFCSKIQQLILTKFHAVADSITHFRPAVISPIIDELKKRGVMIQPSLLSNTQNGCMGADLVQVRVIVDFETSFCRRYLGHFVWSRSASSSTTS